MRKRLKQITVSEVRVTFSFFILFVTLQIQADPRIPSGGGGFDARTFSDEMPLVMQARIEQQLQRNIAALKVQGKLTQALLEPTVSLHWPLMPANHFSDPGYHGIANWVDLNPAYPDQLLDWNCGARSYDLANGYNHAGTDIFLWPYPWILMDQEIVDIVAAAPGVIIGKVDGNDDRSCLNNYSSDWNAVYVQHADGSVAWYGHMKKFSQTSKVIGANVAVGEFLGKVGSAGFSTAPHLHFEIHTSNALNYTVRDPFSGACQIQPSLWAAQPPYYDSKINKISTHSAPPNLNAGCPNPGEEVPNFKNAFQPGDALIYVLYYHDQLAGQVSHITLYKPHGVIHETFDFDMADLTATTYFPASYWYWIRTLPNNAPSGVWIVESNFQGQTYQHRFTVGDVIFADGLESG